MKTKKQLHVDQKNILKTNPQIDTKLVEKFHNLESQLNKIGIDIKPKFNIEPPLGGSNIHLYNS